MKREEAFIYLYNKLISCKNWNDVRNVFNECIEINSEYDFEIFMAEGDDNTVAIDDDYVKFDF